MTQWQEIVTPAGVPRLWVCEAGYGVLAVNETGAMEYVPDSKIQQSAQGNIEIVPIASAGDA